MKKLQTINKFIFFTFLIINSCNSLAAKDGNDESANSISMKAITEMAKSGDIDATHQLCYRFLQGIDVDKDYNHAYFWCSKGANLGHSGSQTLFAEIHYMGHLGPKDLNVAYTKGVGSGLAMPHFAPKGGGSGLAMLHFGIFYLHDCKT